MPTLSPFPDPSGKEGTSSHHQAGQQCGCLMQADIWRAHGGQSLWSDEIRLWYLFGMPSHVLLLCCLPALRKFCCLFCTEELTGPVPAGTGEFGSERRRYHRLLSSPCQRTASWHRPLGFPPPRGCSRPPPGRVARQATTPPVPATPRSPYAPTHTRQSTQAQ